MTLPASWSTVIVTGTYTKYDGTPASGWVTFDSAQVVSVGGQVITPKTITAKLDGTGSISIAIPSTTDPALNITGWAYTVQEHVPNGRAPYLLEVPYGAVTLDLSTAPHATNNPSIRVSTSLQSSDIGVSVASQGAVTAASTAVTQLRSDLAATTGAAQITVSNAQTLQAYLDGIVAAAGDPTLRPDLASTTVSKGASLVLLTSGVNLQTAVSGAAQSASLAGIGGAALVGDSGGGTVQARLNTIQALTDANLRADVASTAAGKGAGMVGYGASTAKAFLDNLGTAGASTGGALVKYLANGSTYARTSQAKDRERVTPEDFGAIGDGTQRPVSQWLTGGLLDRGYANLAAIQVDYPHVIAATDEIDWAGFQGAINSVKAAGGLVWGAGHYKVNYPVVQDDKARIRGNGWLDNRNAANMGVAAVGSRITATTAMTELVRVKSATSTQGLFGVEFSGFMLDANGLAGRCLYASICNESLFCDLVGFQATSVGFDFSDDNGTRPFFDNKIDRIYYSWNGLAASLSSIGFQFRDGGNGGCVQNEVGRVYAITKNGDGIAIHGADNNTFYALGGFLSAGGTGKILRFGNGLYTTPLMARNNQVHYLAGNVQFESNTYGNRIHRMTSETTSVVDNSGGKNYWTIFDYNATYPGEYTHEPYLWSDVHVVPTGGLVGFGGAVIAVSQSVVPCWELADAATQGVGFSLIVPRKWGRGGYVKAITVTYVCGSGGGGNVRLTSSTSSVANVGNVSATQVDSITDTVTTGVGFLKKAKITFAAPLSVLAGDTLNVALQRIGADALDTYTGAMRILSIGAHYTSVGPSAPAIPGWGVTDPVI